MKYLILIVLTVFVITKNPPISDRCDLTTAQNALPVRIFAETTIDGRDQPVLVTRFFHNKATILASELSRCYLNFFDPNLVTASASLLGLLPWLYFFYRTFRQVPRYPLLLAIFTVPALPIVVTFAQVAFIHKVFAIIGLVIWAKTKR